MNLKDKLIRKILDFGKKHRLMVYPSLALVAVISAISHAVYWGKGNGKRLVASVTVAALLITQSLFLTSSAADEEQLSAVQADGSTTVQEGEETGGTADSGTGEAVPAADTDVQSTQGNTAETGQETTVGDTTEETQEATSEDNTTEQQDDIDDVLSPATYTNEESITVEYCFVKVVSSGYVCNNYGSATVQKNEDGKYEITLPSDSDKAYGAFGVESEEGSDNFKFSEWYTNENCTSPVSSSGGTLTLEADDANINNEGKYNLYFMATRTKYPLAIYDGDDLLYKGSISIPEESQQMGVVDPEVTYTVGTAAEYNAYKTGETFAGLEYNDKEYTLDGDGKIPISPNKYVSSIVMNAIYTPYKTEITFDTMKSENADKNITGADEIKIDCTYGQPITLPDSTMGNSVESEAYYITAWDVDGTQYPPGTEIDGTLLFKALDDNKEYPNVIPYTVKAVWAYKEVELSSGSEIISLNEIKDAATITTTYGAEDINASIKALYKQDGSPSSGFAYTVSDDDKNKLSDYYGITCADGAVDAGVTFFTSEYVKNVTTGVDIKIKVTDTNKEDADYTFTVTLVVNPKEVRIDADSVKDEYGKKPTKTYDGTSTIVLTETASLVLDDVLDDDKGKVSVSFNKNAKFDDENAGTKKSVLLSGVSLSGEASSRYTLAGDEYTLVGVDSEGNLTVTVAGIGTIEQRTLSVEMELDDGFEKDENGKTVIYFGESTPTYTLKLTDDSIKKLTDADQAVYDVVDSTEFIKEYLGFTDFDTARTLYSAPGTYTIKPEFDSSGKNYTASASGLSESFTVLRSDGSGMYVLDGTMHGEYYNKLSISPANGYTRIRLLSDTDTDIAEGTSKADVETLGWKSSIDIGDIGDMTDGTIRFQMISDTTGAITEIVTKENMNVDGSGPTLEKTAVSPKNSDIKTYIREYGFGSYYHSQDGIESITIDLYYSSEDSPCSYLYYYFVDENGTSSSVTYNQFQTEQADGCYVATISIGTSSDQRGELVVYAVDSAGNSSLHNKIKLREFTYPDSDEDYYEWMVENNISGADIVVTAPDGVTAVTNTANSGSWYNSLNLSVDAEDTESGVGNITWRIQTQDGMIESYQTAVASSEAVISKAYSYDKVYRYEFKYEIPDGDNNNIAGACTISAVLEDNAGNSVELDPAGPYNVDCISPELVVDPEADSDSYRSGVELSIDVTEGEYESGIASVKLIKLDGNDEIVKEWKPQSGEEYTMKCSYEITGSGTYEIIATDRAGNTNTTTRTFSKLSTTVPDAPEITVTGEEGSNGWYKGDDAPVVRIDCQTLTSDNVEVTTYYKVVTESTSNQASIPNNNDYVELTLETQGDVTIEAWSVSEAGIESTHTTKKIKVDTVSPAIEIVNATVDAAGDMYINFRAKDSTSGVNGSRVLLNGQAIDVTEETNAVLGSFMAEGTKTYTLYVEDIAGNVSETFTFTPLVLNAEPVTDITAESAHLEAEVIEGTYGVDDYYIALKKREDTSYRMCLMNAEKNDGGIKLDCTFNGLASDTVYDYKVYADNEMGEVKSCEGSFRTLSVSATGSVYGTVTYANNITNQEYPVYVSLYEANTVVASRKLENEDDTEYLFTNLVDGSYRVVATNGFLTETAAVTIENGGIAYPDDYAANGGIRLVLNGYSTSVVIEDDAINITADGLESIYDNSVYKGILTDDDIDVLENGGSIDISLHASYIDVSDISSEEQSIFSAKLSSNTVIERYINLYVLKEVMDADGNYVNSTPVRIPELYEPITISFPLGELAGQQIYVASVHGEGSSYSFMNWANADDAVISNNYVTITTRFFSVYALYRIVPSEKTYQVIWKDGDGNTMKTETVQEGMAAVPPEETPTKSESDKYTYTFSGWDTDYSCITGDTVIAAWFTAHNKSSGTVQSADSDNSGNAGSSAATETPAVTTTPKYYTYLGSADSPKTGDSAPIAVLAAVMVLAGAGIAVLKKKKMQS